MAGRLLDDEYSVGQEVDFVDASADTEVDVHLPLEVDRRSYPLQKDVRDVVDLHQQEHIDLSPRTGPHLNGPHTICHYQTFLGLRRIELDRGWWTRHTLELPSANRVPGLCHPTRRAAWDRRHGKTRLEPDPYDDGLPKNVMTRVVILDRRLGTVGRSGLQTLR